MVADSGGDGVEGGAEGSDLVGEAGEGAAGSGAVPVVVDDGAPTIIWATAAVRG